MKKIIILGDSTSSAFGGESESWVSKLSQYECWSQNVRIVDTCAPGATAGSALMSLVKQVAKSPFSAKVIILSVGNCDKIQKPYIANRPSLMKIFRNLFLYLLPIERRVKRNWVKFSTTEWTDDSTELRTQSINNFIVSLKWINRLCNLFQITRIAIIPRSNIKFFPGTAQNNTLFFNLIGEVSAFNFPDSDPLPELKAVEKLVDSNSLSDHEFSSVLAHCAQSSSSRVIAAMNNLSVKWASEARGSDAQLLLHSLAQSTDYRRDIIYFNLASLEGQTGSEGQCQEFLNRALGEDIGSYRVDEDFSRAFRDVMTKDRKTDIVDLHDMSFENSFLDHCHLLPDGQKLVAKKIKDLLSESKFAGDFPARLCFEWDNPEVLEGDTRQFSTFFGINFHNSKHRSGPIHESRLLEILSDCLVLCKVPSTRFSDLISSLIFYEACAQSSTGTEYRGHPSVAKEFSRVKRITQQLSLDYDLRELSLSSEQADYKVKEISALIDDNLDSILSNRVNARLRLRNIMNWYFKESIYFGFNSSIDMCFDRNKIRATRELIGILQSLISINNLETHDKSREILDFLFNIETQLFSFYKGKINEIYNGLIVEEENQIFLRLRKDWKKLADDYR